MSLISTARRLADVRVYESPLMQVTQVPVRPHIWKGSWAYHKRINKKWLKRYGTKEVVQTAVVGNCLYVPVGYAKKIAEQLIGKENRSE